MQVWNVLRAARWKCRTQKIAKNWPSGQYLLHMSPQYGELRPTNGWDRLAGLGHLIIFQRVSRLGSVTALHFIRGCQPNSAALNRGRHLYSARRPSRWALAHILVWAYYNPVLFWTHLLTVYWSNQFTHSIIQVKHMTNRISHIKYLTSNERIDKSRRKT